MRHCVNVLRTVITERRWSRQNANRINGFAIAPIKSMPSLFHQGKWRVEQETRCLFLSHSFKNDCFEEGVCSSRNLMTNTISFITHSCFPLTFDHLRYRKLASLRIQYKTRYGRAVRLTDERTDGRSDGQSKSTSTN